MAEYQSGDKVKVLSGAHMAEDSGLDATIVRRMVDADDYEVVYDVDQPGTSPIVHPDRLRLVSPKASADASPQRGKASSKTADGE